MDLSRGGVPLEHRQDLEIQGHWILATPAKPVPMKRPLISSNAQETQASESSCQVLVDVSSAKLHGTGSPRGESTCQGRNNSGCSGSAFGSRSSAEASASSGQVHCLNAINLLTLPMGNHTTQLPHRTVLAFTDAAVTREVTSSLAPLLYTRNGDSKEPSASQTQLLLDGKEMLIANICSGSIHSPLQITYNGIPAVLLTSLPKKSASSSANEIMTSPLAPITPEKGKRVQKFQPQEVVDLESKGLNEKGSVEEIGILQSATTENPMHLCSHNDFSKPVAPLTPGKGKRIQDWQPHEINDLVDGGLIEGSMQENCMYKEVFSQPEQVKPHADASSEKLSSQQPETERDKNGEKQGVNLNKTPRKKAARRKKHRPKVIQDGKSAKTPKPVTPKPARNKENLTPKRVYVRKKKVLNTSETPSGTIEKTIDPCSSSAVRETIDLLTRSEIKSVKRSLNFNSESQAIEGCQVSTATNVQSRARETCSGTTTSCGRKFTVQVAQGLEVVVNNLPAGITFDLNRSVNQMLEEYIRLRENPTAPAQFSRREFIREHLKDFGNAEGSANGISMRMKDQKQINSNNYSDAILIEDDIENIGTKRDYSHINVAQHCSTNWSPRDINSVHAYEEIKRTSKCQETSIQSPYFPQIYKKRRTEKGQTWGCNKAVLHNSRHFTFADAQKSMTLDRVQDSELILAFGPTERATKKRSKVQNRACKPTPIATTVDCSHLLLTHEKPKRSDDILESKNCGSQACMEALFADTCVKITTKKRTKKGQAHLVSSMSLNTNQEHKVVSCKYGSVGQKSVGLTASSAGNFLEKNLNHLQISSIQDCHSSISNIQESLCASLQSQAIVPYVDPIDVIVEKMKCLNINGDLVDVTVQAQNALILYGGGSMMVPYEGSFDLFKKRRPRAKVDLDPETNRAWKLLMGKESSDGADGLDMDKEKWEEERRVFHGRADSFIARMHLIQGDRRFSKWNGSVVDSVVGVFLTQNVSDHLSSSAFMSLASRFPLRSRGNDREPNAERMNTSIEQGDGSILASIDTIKWQEKMSRPEQLNPGSMGSHKAGHSEQNEAADVSGSLGSNSSDGMDSSKVKGLDVHVREQEIRLETPQDRTDAPVSFTGGTSLVKAEDRMSMDDVVSSQDFVISSGNSLDSLIQTTVQVGSSSESISGAKDLVIISKCGGSDNSTSFMEPISIREMTRTHESYNHGDGRMSSTENCGAVDQEACTEVEKRKIVTLDSLTSACPSFNTSNSLFNHAQHDFRDVSSAPSMSHHFHSSLNSEPVGKENVDVVREESRYCLPSTAFEITKTNNIKTIEGKSGPSSDNTTEGTGWRMLPNFKTTAAIDSHVSISKLYMQTLTCSETQICLEKQSGCDNNLPRESTKDSSSKNIPHELPQVKHEHTVKFQQERKAEFQPENTRHAVDILTQMQECREKPECQNSFNNLKETFEVAKTADSNLKDEVCSSQKVQPETEINASKAKKVKAETEKKKTFDWDSLRKEAFAKGAKKESSNGRMDSLNWEAVRNADVNEISNTIRERGMNNVLAERIKDFLNRLVRDHGSIDLEWLRDVPPDKAKEYLLSIRGLGLKSVECVRLLTLHHLAFPVDTNVGRICVRLGWVPLQPLPESLQLHLLELYPMMENIQKYLWPRLCTLDQRTLYELHYQMITFGKVFCTKSRPNCNACPMRGDCKHFASAFASARLALPGPEENSLVTSTIPIASENDNSPIFSSILLPQLEGSQLSQEESVNNKCEPIIEEPATPEHECIETLESAIEDAFYEDPDEIPTIKLNLEEFTQNLQNFMHENNMETQDGDMSKALVAITPEVASIPMPKLKNVSRLRTEHQVYELPDSHPLLLGMDQREPDDPCPYLLAVWTPGETAQSTEPPESCCRSQDTGKLCDRKTCFACNSIREAHAQTVRGTLLIPCRTAMRGSFPLNGTYFQVNEVFADHSSSRNPIDVPRKWIWNLPRRTVYFGTSVPTIFKGLTTEDIQHCFWRGFLCVRGFERVLRAPRPLYARLHFPASKAPKNKKTLAEEDNKTTTEI